LITTYIHFIPKQEEHADAAIGNVTGSNAVNVFLGIGLPWTIATIYAKANGTEFTARSCGFGLNCFVYVVLALSTLALLGFRRLRYGGELGGDPTAAKMHSALLVSMWFLYIIISSNRYYGNIDDLWDITGSLAPREGGHSPEFYCK
jgi:solute carrier family 8 (sodium/calcium exchanger)